MAGKTFYNLSVTSLFFGIASLFAQSVPSAVVPSPAASSIAPAPAHVNIVGVTSEYLLGPGDQFTTEIAELEELNGKIHRINSDGTVTLPLVGRVNAAGLTLTEFEAVLDKKLELQLKAPDITVTVTETLSKPVTVMGFVNAPGVHQMRVRQSLTEVLSQAGGLRPDAGYRVTVTRQMDAGELPLPNVVRDEQHQTVTGEVNLSDLLEAVNPSANITILPHDLITVPRAKIVYVIGEVRKSGGFTLDQKTSMSVIQAVALAEGVGPTAAKGSVLILRQVPGDSARTQTQIDIGKIMAGKAPDVDLLPNDILYVPNSMTKVITRRVVDTAISSAAGALIWRGL